MTFLLISIDSFVFFVLRLLGSEALFHTVGFSLLRSSLLFLWHHNFLSASVIAFVGSCPWLTFRHYSFCAALCCYLHVIPCWLCEFKVTGKPIPLLFTPSCSFVASTFSYFAMPPPIWKNMGLIFIFPLPNMNF